MTPDKARRLLAPLDLYAGDAEDLVTATGADTPGVGAMLNPELHATARGIEAVRRALKDNAEDMARMIAGMREEYAIAYLDRDGNIDMLDEGYKTLAAAQRRRDQLLAKVRPYTKIMRRPVGEWEEA